MPARVSEPPSTSSTDRAAGRLEVGRVARAHGIRGEVLVDPVSNRPERFAVGARVFLDGRAVQIRSSRVHQGKWLLEIDGVTDRTTAESLRGAVVTGDPLGPLPTDEYWVDDIIGLPVVDAIDDQVAGTVVAVQPNPAHDLLVLDDGRLVPMVFVVEMTADRVVVDAPPGVLRDLP